MLFETSVTPEVLGTPKLLGTRKHHTFHRRGEGLGKIVEDERARIEKEKKKKPKNGRKGKSERKIRINEKSEKNETKGKAYKRQKRRENRKKCLKRNMRKKREIQREGKRSAWFWAERLIVVWEILWTELNSGRELAKA